MNHKIKWTTVEKMMRIVEVIAIVCAALVVIQIPHQIKEWRSNQEDRSFNLLAKLDEKLKQGMNREIFNTIRRNKPILKESGGRFESYELDYYLDDLGSINDAYSRKIIDKDSVYEWFSDYLIKTFKNKEIGEYLRKIRKGDPQYYSGLEEFAKEIIK